MYEQMVLWNRQCADEDLAAGEVVLDTDGRVILFQQFFRPVESDDLFSRLQTEINWQQETIQIFGRSTPLPRQTAWYGDAGKSYTYSGIEQHPQPWIPTLTYIQNKIEIVANVKFNSVLLNLYRDGNDSVAWHSDDEPELGQNPVIGSVSFGGTRRFCLKHKYLQNRKDERELAHGSLLLMLGETQHHWLHQVPKTKKQVAPRINLTFRVIH